MSSSSNVQSCVMIPEASFGSLVDNFPSTAIFDGSELFVPILRGEVFTPGEVPLNEDNSVRGGFYGKPGVVSTTVRSGVRQKRRAGQLSLTVDMPQAAGNTDGSGFWLTHFLASCLFDGGAPDQSTETVTGASATVINVADQAGYDVGQIVQALVNNRPEYSTIVNKTNDTQDTLTITPAFSITPSSTPMATLRTFGSKNGTRGPSLAFRIDGDKYRTYCFGCRLGSLTITAENGRAKFAFVFECAFILDTHEAVTSGGNWVDDEFYLTSSNILHFLDCEVILSNAINTQAEGYPVIPGRTSLNVDAVSITLTNELTPCPTTTNILAMSDYVITNRTLEVSVETCDWNETFARDLLDRVHRNLVVGMGPGGEGEGMAVVVPAAFLTVDPGLRSGSPLVKQTLTWQAGAWRGDVGSPANDNLIDTPFRIGFGVTI